MLGRFTGRNVYDYDVNLMAIMLLRGNDGEVIIFASWLSP
jgi:hypothetical protein